MMLKRNAQKLFGIGMRYVESTNGHDVSSWVTVVPSFTTFGGRDPNCFGYDAIFRRIWANGKGTRRVDSRFFCATIGSSIIKAHIKIIALYQDNGKVINKDFLKMSDVFSRRPCGSDWRVSRHLGCLN